MSDEMKKVFDAAGIEYSEDKASKLTGYMDEILKINEHVNLTAITDREEFIQKHYVDSLLCAGLESFKTAEKVIDVGTGGGFPGVPLAIAFPEKKFVLADSLNKRIKIVNGICESLGITNVTAVHGRAEELAKKSDMRESFDLCVSRAVASMNVLAEYCLPFVRPGGHFIAYKGPECDEELADAAAAIDILGGEITEDVRPARGDVPFDHRLIVIEKKKSTPPKYPRKPGTPSKEPLK